MHRQAHLGRLRGTVVESPVSPKGFPGGSDGKEPTCNAGGPGSSPRSLEEGMATDSMKFKEKLGQNLLKPTWLYGQRLSVSSQEDGVDSCSLCPELPGL